MRQHIIDLCQSAGGRLRRGGLGSRCGSDCSLDLSIGCAIQPHCLRPEGTVVCGELDHTAAVAHQALGPGLAGGCMHRDILIHQTFTQCWSQLNCIAYCTCQMQVPRRLAAAVSWILWPRASWCCCVAPKPEGAESSQTGCCIPCQIFNIQGNPALSASVCI